MRIVTIGLAAPALVAAAGCSTMNPGNLFGSREVAPTPSPVRSTGPELAEFSVPAGGFRSFALTNPVERVCVDPDAAHGLLVSYETETSETAAAEARVAVDATPGDCVPVGLAEFTLENVGVSDILIQFVYIR